MWSLPPFRRINNKKIVLKHEGISPEISSVDRHDNFKVLSMKFYDKGNSILEQNVFSEKAYNNITHTLCSTGNADDEDKIYCILRDLVLSKPKQKYRFSIGDWRRTKRKRIYMKLYSTKPITEYKA
jgi:hypothetical protein